MTRMKVGLYIATQFTEQTDVMAARAEMLEQVRVARQSGFASLWVPHHYATEPMQMLAPVPMLAWLLQEAEGMVIGANILIMPLLNPIHVAEDAVTLDLLSGGKYVLGVGIGYRAAEFDAFNVPLKERVPRMKESVEIMRKLWTEDRVTHKGKYFTIEDMGVGLKPVRKGGPPIWIAGVVDAAVKRAAEIGDAWLITNFAHLKELVPQMKLYRETLAAVGKPFPEDAPITRECYIGPTNARARRVQGGAAVQVRRLFVVGPGFSVGRSRVVPAAVRGLRQGPVHHRRQGLCEGRDPALQRIAGRESLFDARAVAGIAARNV
ncbi:MAG: LLM class flavin-dependent oxidoreductase [Betaproteobacteria bacterium]|nr:LLM class flavin-dependent oxidoreductase [Betaproteobacteria bacterium]